MSVTNAGSAHDAVQHTARSREALLDNPILNALLTEQRPFGVAHGEARRYIPAIGPLAGVPDQSRESYEALTVLAGAGGILALFLPDPPAAPAGWSLLRGGHLTQMICRSPRLVERRGLPAGASLRRLGPGDVTAMIELATLTEPGPFRECTIELGNFYGILEGGRLLAMAGQRMRVHGFVEVSAVCTHPDARGLGYAALLMSEVMREIAAEGATPILHALAENPAIRLYNRLGFTHRRDFQLAVIKRD